MKQQISEQVKRSGQPSQDSGPEQVVGGGLRGAVASCDAR